MRNILPPGAVILASVCALAVFAVPQLVRAVERDNVHGWAWNASTGWIAVDAENCATLNRDADPDPCVRYGQSYGLSISDTGVLTGYMWSARVGWMCVGATCAGSDGVVPADGWQARVNAITKEVSGWAKVLARGDAGWVSFTCANTGTCDAVPYRTEVDPANGQFAGYAWNGAADGRGFGWIAWWPAFGGVTTDWRPVPRCTVSGAACQADVECQLPGELCCLGGAPCGRCAGVGAWCAQAAECNGGGGGALCCRPGVPCGRCADTGDACGAEATCGGARDACCPPGAVCTGGAAPTFEDRNGDGRPDGVDTDGDGRPDALDLDGDGAADQGGASLIGVCTLGPPELCTERDQCSDGTRPCDAEVRICAGGADARACRTDADCAGVRCAADVGIRTDVVRSEDLPNGIAVPCAGDDPNCRKIIGKCTQTNRLCAVDGNCPEDERCGKLYLPWVQALYGGIASAGSVGSARTAPPPSGEHNATYCITAGDRIVNFLSASATCGLRPQYTYSADPRRRPGADGRVARMDVRGLLSGRYGPPRPLPGISVSRGDVVTLLSVTPVALRGGVFLVDGKDLEVRAPGLTMQNDGGAGTFVIRGGNLHITSNITYDTARAANVRSVASVGWVVLTDAQGNGGDVIVDPAVTEIVGAIYAQGTVRTGTTGGVTQDRPLTVRGALVAKRFLFERLAAGATPAERVIADGRILAHTPPGFGDIAKALPTIRQTTP